MVNSNITLYENYENITIEVLNKVVANQKVSITETELERLKKIPLPADGGVRSAYDLPLNDQTSLSFESLV